MNNYKQYFKGKKITCMGLGLLGRGAGDALFLLECGAELTITDLKTAEQLKDSVAKFKKYPKVKFVLGEHKLEDFKDRDMILKSAGVPLDSIYIAEARKNNIPVEMSASLFAKLSGVPVIGVTGTRGKSTTTYMIEHILKTAGKKTLLGGNVRGVSTLTLLKKTKGVDFAVFELDSWQLQGFGDAKISPHVAVFTTFYSDHLNYYKNDLGTYLADKTKIFQYQKPEDFLIMGKQPAPSLDKWRGEMRGQITVPEEKLPAGFKLNIPGTHNEYNAMLAVTVTRCLGIKEDKIKQALKSFKPVEGRLEYLKTFKGVKIYNDNNSTTPEATIVALRALGDEKVKKVVLIMGGDDKNLDMTKLVKEIPLWCSKVILFKERGTNRIRDEIFAMKGKDLDVYEEDGLEATVARAVSVAKKGESLVFSPAFSSFGKYFKNEYDRSDQFVKLIKALK